MRTAKPKLYWRWGAWHCYHSPSATHGSGYTMRDAYDSWALTFDLVYGPRV